MSGPIAASVVLLRNVNLGHPGSPSRAQLEAAFQDAGAPSARSVQTNGTLILTGARQAAVLLEAIARLEETLGRRLDAILRPGPAFKAMIEALPAPQLGEGAYREVITFFDPPEATFTLPPAPSRVRFLQQGPGWVQSWIWKERHNAGQPAAAIEDHLKTPATSRTRGTVARIHTELTRSPR